MSEGPTGAVFLSYASQDAPCAQRICAALRDAGIDVWFDQSELRGGDSWDREINDQIHRCRLFIPLISHNTESRDEGYFRREWNVALDRLRDMADHRTFLVPVALDPIPEHSAAVPARFRQVQWIRLADGIPTESFVARIRQLLGPHSGQSAPAPPVPLAPGKTPRPWRAGSALAAAALLAVAAVAVLVWHGRTTAVRPPTAAPASQAALRQRSIAVLPFADLSEQHDQEYLAEGMAEELIDRLAQMSELRVISRTSTFQFRGKGEDLSAIDAKLSVANVLEGSVRRAGERLRIDVKLVATADGATRWSQRYDRAVSDIFKLQDEIATEVVLALKARLTEAASAEQSQTHSEAAHTRLLEGRFFMERWASGDAVRAIAAYRDAIAADPSYALAWAELSWAALWASPQDYATCSAAADRAIELRPDLAQAHASRGWCESTLGYNWDIGESEFAKALALQPNNTRALYGRGRLARVLRRNEESLRYYASVLERDPINPFVLTGYSISLVAAGRTAEAVENSRMALQLSPNIQQGHWYAAYSLLWDNQLAEAANVIALEPIISMRRACEALIERARKNNDAADRALRELLATNDAMQPYFVAEVYANRGDAQAAIAWLERARLGRRGFFSEFNADPAFEPIRKNPAFLAYLQQVKLPE